MIHICSLGFLVSLCNKNMINSGNTLISPDYDIEVTYIYYDITIYYMGIYTLIL